MLKSRLPDCVPKRTALSDSSSVVHVIKASVAVGAALISDVTGGAVSGRASVENSSTLRVAGPVLLWSVELTV